MRIKSNKSFNHLHVHTEMSSLDGLNRISDLVKHARTMGFGSLAITDHGNVSGHIKFLNECRKKDILGPDGKPLGPIKPIFGFEAYLARDMLAKNEDGRRGNRHLLLLAKNEVGYKNLCTLSQRSWTDGRYIDARIDLPTLAAHSEGLICSSACLSSVVNANLLRGRYDQAKKVATLLKDIFKEDFFLEVMFHGIEAEARIISDILRLGQELGIAVFASNDCHYCRKEQALSQEVLMAMSTSKCLKDPRRIHFPYHEFYLKSAEEMGKIFGTHPELLLNTCAVAERVEDFMKPGGMRMPLFDIAAARKPDRHVIHTPPPKDVMGDAKDRVSAVGAGAIADLLSGDQDKVNDTVKAYSDKTSDEVFEEAYAFMCELAEKGMKKLGYDRSEAHVKQLQLELSDVRVAWTANRMDFATYFLIVWDYIEFARSNKIITGCGRGSGYASVLLRTLGITYGPDPLKHGLIWERFLGFDDKHVLLDSDWGLGEAEVITLGGDDLDEDRDVADDTGGVDRY